MGTLGIHVGGSGVEGAIVDTSSGELLSERVRRPTPKPATPKKIARGTGILRGGASKKLAAFVDQLTVEVPIRVARFRNNAGIIGAAIVADA